MTRLKLHTPLNNYNSCSSLYTISLYGAEILLYNKAVLGCERDIEKVREKEVECIWNEMLS